MCDFCEEGKYKSLTDFKVNSKSRYCIEIENKKHLIIREQVGNSPYWNDLLHTIEPIKYCMYCGKKLGDDKE